ncbi:hypothetical protein [Kordia jejudonensis]|uniref:hypothetical protein n=1 Tax=Kordia jejudonensis TaxID=1348245 RepID=UPI00062927D7|nr:hypothetical protein [Kordia jejudonensis]
MEKPNLVIDEEQKKVFLDGEIIGELNSSNFSDAGKYQIAIRSKHIDKLSTFKIFDIYNDDVGFFEIKIDKRDSSFHYNWLSIESSLSFIKGETNYLYLDIDLTNWNMPFSFKSFLALLIDEIKDDELISIFKDDIKDILEEGLCLDVYINEESNDLETLYYEVLEMFKLKFDTIFLELENVNASNLKNTFTFPPEIQSSCEQYLIYFATFLKDIGINAETNIESKAHETLFTVIPKDEEEALDKIKEALQMYLSLPESPEFESVASEFQDVGVQQLASQVLFLKSQLMLANSAIQMKDATIKSLNMTNYQQNVVIESHQTKKENEEELVGDFIKTNEIKVPGFTFNLPELLRQIKRKFK